MAEIFGSEILGLVRKDPVEELRIILETPEVGQNYLDIRMWTSVEAGHKDAKEPTERGFCLNVVLLPEFIDTLKTVEDRLIKAKLLGWRRKP